MPDPAENSTGLSKARLSFETLISNLSARFVSLPPDQVDDQIEHALESVRDFFQVERCGLLRVQQEGGVIRLKGKLDHRIKKCGQIRSSISDSRPRRERHLNRFLADH